MSVQRTRSQELATIYRAITVVDNRGNESVQPTMDNPHVVRVHAAPDRSARAEVPGEMQIDVLTLRIPYMLADVNLRSRVFFREDWWDVVAPPADHGGSRHVRHSTITIRRRPGGGGLIV